MEVRGLPIFLLEHSVLDMLPPEVLSLIMYLEQVYLGEPVIFLELLTETQLVKIGELVT